MKVSKGNIAVRTESLLRPIQKPEEYFNIVRETVIGLLRDRGYLPGNLVSLDIGEAVIMFVAGDESPDEMISKLATILAALRVALTPNDLGRTRYAERFLATAKKRAPSAPHELVSIGVELRDALEFGKPPLAKQAHTLALNYFLSHGAVEPTSTEMFDYLASERGLTMGDPANFKKTYRGWRKKWRAFEVAKTLEEFDSED